MTKLQKKQNLTALAATIVIWFLLAFLFSLLTLAPKKTVYKTVRITLDSPSVPKITEKRIDSAPPAPALQSQPLPSSPVEKIKEAPKTQPAKKAEVSEKQQTTPKQNSAAKKTTEKAESKNIPSSKPAQQTLQKSVDELIAEQRAKPRVQKKEFDWSSFDEEASETVSSSDVNDTKTVKAQSSFVELFEGTAGISSDGENNSPVSATSRNTAGGRASSATMNALDSISATVFSASSSNGVTGSSSVKSAGAPNGRISLYMNDGSSRTLLEPLRPVIVLSEKAAATIDTTKNLTVRFTVLPDGHVDLNSIKITPGAIITPLVQAEIAGQISSWRFNQDSASATAVFPYKIEKR